MDYKDLFTQAKRPIPEVLDWLGIEHRKDFFSIRQETKPSCHIYGNGKSLWCDFGSGEHGTAVDLLMKLKGVDNVAAARLLVEGSPIATAAPIAPMPVAPAAPKLVVSEVIGAPQDPRLIRYIQKRGIAQVLAAKYLTEIIVKYAVAQPDRINNGVHTLGWQSVDGSWHTRNSMQGFWGRVIVGHQHITAYERGSDFVVVFEGQFSHLSALSMPQFARLQSADSIVLNSVNNKFKAVEYILRHGYRHVGLMLDRDQPGRQATRDMMQMIGHAARVVDLVETNGFFFSQYPANWDLNDILTSKFRYYEN